MGPSPFPLAKIVNAEDLFEDVPEDHWGKDAIVDMILKRLMVGYPDGLFHPEKNLSAAMVYTVMARIADADIVTTGDEWLDNVTAWAEEQGIAIDIDPEEDVTRAQMAEIMAKAAGADADVDPVDWAVENGILIGYEDGEIKPENKLTRAEFATMLTRYIGE